MQHEIIKNSIIMNSFTKALVAIMLVTAMVGTFGCNKSENQDNDVRVTTYTPQDITQTSVVCGGDVIVTPGLSLNELGVCWSTKNNPTVEDTHIFTTNWNSTFVCTITGLEPDTKYHVRAYALRGLEYYYGEDKSFTTTENNGGGGGNNDNHACVDLGLPSGTLWATCNVGAELPEDYGDYFAWGETQPKDVYSLETYQYANGTSWEDPQLTKYCNSASYGYNGFTDNLTILQAGDDAVTANWGSGWCTPTREQWAELWANTTNQWTKRNGVHGKLFTAPNGNSLFLPAAGYRYDGSLDYVGINGYYWSSTLDTGDPNRAWHFYFDSGGHCTDVCGRTCGQSVRPVRFSF